MPKKLTLEDCQKVAKERGGKCLSTEYKNSKIKMLWECKQGHQWERRVDSILYRGSWCSHCNGKVPYTLHDCQQAALKKGGKCLSTEYKNCMTKMLWECKEGHQWETRFDGISRNDYWCAVCLRNTLEDCQRIAKDRGGKCLSTEYKNGKIKLSWECREGHQWDACLQSLKHVKSWCPHCSGKATHTLDNCKAIAKERGGKCLSTEYKNCMTKMLWECKEGHQWNAMFQHVKNNKSWCPYCLHKSESLTRDIFQELLDKPFNKIRPKWLKGLELDGYNKELKLAFEYQGIQHYQYKKFFHRSKEER